MAINLDTADAVLAVKSGNLCTRLSLLAYRYDLASRVSRFGLFGRSGFELQAARYDNRHTN